MMASTDNEAQTSNNLFMCCDCELNDIYQDEEDIISKISFPRSHFNITNYIFQLLHSSQAYIPLIAYVIQ